MFKSKKYTAVQATAPVVLLPLLLWQTVVRTIPLALRRVADQAASSPASGKRGDDFAKPIRDAAGGVPGVIMVRVLPKRDRLRDSASGASRIQGAWVGSCSRC